MYDSQCKLTAVREIQCLICSHLHQMFITDPPLAKLLHFQVNINNNKNLVKELRIIIIYFMSISFIF